MSDNEVSTTLPIQSNNGELSDDGELSSDGELTSSDNEVKGFFY